MASYDQAAAEVFSDLSEAGVSQSTMDAIQKLVESSDSSTIETYTPGGTVSDGVEVVLVTEDITSPIDGVKAIIMPKGTSANVVFGADSTVENMVLLGSNNDVAFEGDKDITIEMNGGKDTVSTGAGEDVFIIKGGEAKINSGDGKDVIHLEGENTGDATIDAGDGFDRLSIKDAPSNHEFSFDAATGMFGMNSPVPVNMSGIEVVTFDMNGSGDIKSDDKITVLTTDFQDNIAAKLYRVVLNREAIDSDGRGGADDTLDGLFYWMHEFDAITSRKGDVKYMVEEFLKCDEVTAQYKDLDEAAVVNKMLANVGLDTPEHAEWAASLVQQLVSGEKDQAQVALEITSSEAVNNVLGVGPEGEKYVYFVDSDVTA